MPKPRSWPYWTKAYSAVDNAKQRCTNPKHYNYKYYGKRGIEFKFNSILEACYYVMDLPDYSELNDLQLDRINNNGHYEEGNLQWVSRSEQQMNKRNSSNIPTDQVLEELRKGGSNSSIANKLGLHREQVRRIRLKYGL